ncbi:hypothetical protein PTKIN_Ptkin16aG0112100 [Pterospermum kingtungense]
MLRSPFTNWRKIRVNLTMQEYLQYLKSEAEFSPHIGLAYLVGSGYFLDIENSKFSLEEQHMNPYLDILHCAPAWANIGVHLNLKNKVAVLDSAFYGQMMLLWQSIHRDDAPTSLYDLRTYEELDAE